MFDRKKWQKEYWEKNKDWLIPHYKQYYQDHKDEYKRRGKEWAKMNPEKAKAIYNRNNNSRRGPNGSHALWRLKTRYGITPEYYDSLISQQDGKCPICEKSLNEVRRHVDHCHETKVVRGILCGKCNQGIGLLKHDPKAMVNAIEYLTKYLNPNRIAV